MKHFIFKSMLTLSLILLCGALVWANSPRWISFGGATNEDYRVTVLSSDNSSTILQIDITGIAVEDILVGGEIFQYLKLNHFGTTQEIGSPALPIVPELVAIPGRCKVRASVISTQTKLLEGYNVFPFQTPTKDDQPPPNFTLDRKAYSRNAWFPENPVTLGDIGIMRDLRVVPVQVVPFRFNPVTQTLEVATQIVVKLEYYGISNQAVKDKMVSEITPTIADWYRGHIVNFDNLNLRISRGTDEFQTKYLIICPNGVISYIQPLADFRNAQGYGVEIRPMQPGFNTADQFHDYIHQLYVSDGLEYVLMVGDWCPATGHTITPMYMWVDSWSDSWYSMVDPWPNNNLDYLADLAIGRFVFDTIAELQLMMDKTMDYLLAPSTADNWAEHSLLVAHQEDYPLKYTQCKEQIRTFPYSIQTPIFGQAYGGAGATNQYVVNYLNNLGSGILNYRGHGSQTEWWQWGPSGSFTAANIAQLTNTDKLFVHFDVCCDNMDFPGYNGDCLAESFMKSPVAAVAINSAIIPSYTIPNHDYDKEFYKAIFNEGIVNIGYASNYANITVYTVHGALGESNIRTYLWLGDAAIDPWTKTPANLVVNHLPVVYIGMSSLDVSVMMNGLPVEDAMVCAQNSETYSVGYTGPAGTLTLNFDGPLTLPGNLELTVTCHNGIPYQADIQVIPPSGPYVIFDSATINDALGWLPNGQLDFGEAVQLTIAVENVGVAVANNVSVTIATGDEYTDVTDSTAFYGNVGAGSTVSVPNGFALQVEQGIPDLHSIPFSLTATSDTNIWVTNFSLTAHAPVVEFEQLVIDDPTGNNNHQLDPGETANFNVTLKNNGSTVASNVLVIISANNTGITIPVNAAVIASLPAGGTATVVYSGIQAASSMQNGTVVDFDLDITAAGGYITEACFTITVGDVRYQPSGPDAYGYWAYDMYDGLGAPVYNWIEVAPMAGGPGQTQPFSDDQTRQVDLPFNFKYYGSNYNQASICSNGWIALGYVTSTAYTNTGLPNSAAPNNMVCAFWDDLYPPTGGQIAWYYDVANHLFIVEYYQIRHLGGANPETFEVIFYNPNYYPTNTGDGEIQVNYNTLMLTTSCTVGQENGAGNVGLQYLYNGTYDQYAMPLENAFAIKFTTGCNLGGDLEMTLTPSTTPIIIPPGGGNFSYTFEIENVGTTQAFFQAWTDVLLPDSTTYGPLLIRSGLSIAPGAIISRTLTQTIPGTAPAGNYEYWGHVGVFPDDPWSEDSFPFTKQAGEGEGISQYTDWSVTGWDEPGMTASLPIEFNLSQNYPNPFNPVTYIDFALPATVNVSLSVFNLLGQKVATLYEGMTPAGFYSVSWNAQDLASGVYFYHLQAGDFHCIKKCILMK